MGSRIAHPKKSIKQIPTSYNPSQHNHNTHTQSSAQSDEGHEIDKFSPENLCNRYKFIRYLGHGSYGDVCLAKSLPHTKYKYKYVSIKKMKFHYIADAKRLLRELRILRILSDHKSIIKLIDILPPKKTNFNKIYFVYKYCANTDLAKFIFTSQ
eukprot:880620_1